MQVWGGSTASNHGSSVEDHLRENRMDQDGSWGTDVEVAALSHLLGTNIALYDIPTGKYVRRGPYLVDPAQQVNDTRLTIYIHS